MGEYYIDGGGNIPMRSWRSKMSVRCKDCGAVAGRGYELGHKSDCPTLKKQQRIGRMYDKVRHGDDSNCTTGPMFETEEEAAEAADNGRNTGGKNYR